MQDKRNPTPLEFFVAEESVDVEDKDKVGALLSSIQGYVDRPFFFFFSFSFSENATSSARSPLFSTIVSNSAKKRVQSD